MRHPFRLVILFVGVWLLTGAAAAQTGEEGGRPACTAANSNRVTVDDIWLNERRLRNRCVGVEGYRLGDLIFDEQLAVYRYSARRSAAAAGIVGIPYPAQLESDSPGLMRGIYYGRLESCREAQRNYARTLRNLQGRPASDEIILVHLYGFCATSTGPAVRVEHAEEAPSADLRRLTGDRSRASLGELLPMNARYRYPAILPWLVDIAIGGCRSNFQVQDPPADGPPEGRGGSVVLPNLGPAQRDQLMRWCAGAARQHALFTVAKSSPASDDGTKLDTLICLCLTDDCTGRWPVALIDTGWSTPRPYLCQRVRLKPRTTTFDEDGRVTSASEYSYEFADEWIVGGAWQSWGFPEPKSPDTDST